MPKVKDAGLGERIAAVVALYPTKTAAAEVAGKSTDTLLAYETGRSVPPFDVLTRLAALKDVRLDWLATGNGGMFVEDDAGKRTAGDAIGRHVRGLTARTGSETAGREELDDDFVLIPRYEIQASAGPGTFADSELVVDHLAFRADWLRRSIGVDPNNLVLITAVGDSMEPVIRAGDLLLIDTAVDEFVDDAIYVVVRQDNLIVKRVQRFFNGMVTIKSDNPAYVEETLGPDEASEIQVAGRLRWIARMV